MSSGNFQSLPPDVKRDLKKKIKEIRAGIASAVKSYTSPSQTPLSIYPSILHFWVVV